MGIYQVNEIYGDIHGDYLINYIYIYIRIYAQRLGLIRVYFSNPH